MSSWLRLTLITMTVGGGFTGLVVSLQIFIQSLGQQWPSILIAAIMLLLYIYVFVAGLLFVQSPQRTGPLFWALLIQIPWISSSILVFNFAAGLGFLLGIKYADSGIGFAPGWYYAIGAHSDLVVMRHNPVIIGMNICAFGFLVLLLRSSGMPARSR